MQLPAVTGFPSREHYLALKQKLSPSASSKIFDVDKLTDEEKMWNRNYNYAWQRVAVDNPWDVPDGKGSFILGPDDKGDPLYNPHLVKAAVEMFRRWRRHRPRDLPEPKFHDAEQIAHVEECCKLARRYMDHGDVRRKAALRGVTVPAPLPLIDTSWRTAAEIRAERERLGI
jgi:hypothetical protein